jgi:hypothetical protein
MTYPREKSKKETGPFSLRGHRPVNSDVLGQIRIDTPPEKTASIISDNVRDLVRKQLFNGNSH